MRILIIEDQEKLAKSLKKGLEQEGYAADYLLDGESGQRRIETKQQDYDAVILDLMLPKKDGIEVCQSWRSQNIAIPVLMLTAKDAVSDKVVGLDGGADDYMVKPFGHQELLARLRALLRRPRQTLPIKLVVGDLLLDTSNKQALCKNIKLPLTVKEFVLLEYFMRNPNQVLSRRQILEHIWNYDFDSFANVVDVHVKNLRKKLSKMHYEQVLETVRGMGYRLTV
jgi:DNA-binding response OmpR family regulator